MACICRITFHYPSCIYIYIYIYTASYDKISLRGVHSDGITVYVCMYACMYDTEGLSNAVPL